MTTAARPTWNAAVGQSNEGGWSAGGQISMQFSARDLPGHTKLKTRQPGQGTKGEVQERDLRTELDERELQYEEEKNKKVDYAQEKIQRLKGNKLLLLQGGKEEGEALLKNIREKYDDSDDAGDGSESDESESDSEDDEEEELMRELEKIKKEREEEFRRKELQEQEVEANQQKHEILMGNPLTQSTAAKQGSAALKRKWNDDVVFKNQSRNEREVKKRFINDTIRNDFHRRFLKNYIQ